MSGSDCRVRAPEPYPRAKPGDMAAGAGPVHFLRYKGRPEADPSYRRAIKREEDPGQSPGSGRGSPSLAEGPGPRARVRSQEAD